MGTKETLHWETWQKKEYFTITQLATLFCNEEPDEEPTSKLSDSAKAMRELLKEHLKTKNCVNKNHTGRNGLRAQFENDEDEDENIQYVDDDYSDLKYYHQPRNIFHLFNHTGGIEQPLDAINIAPDCLFTKEIAVKVAKGLKLRPIFLFPEEKITALSGSEKTDAKTLRHLLDDKQEWYSEELAVAVKAWLALFDGGKPLSMKKSARLQIKDWLNSNYGKKYAGSTLERIVTVINPNKRKKGGAPPSSISKK